MLLYKCDGCGAEAQVSRPASLPAGWREVPPGLDYPGQHVCPECFLRQTGMFALAAAGAGFQMAAELARMMGFGPVGRGGQKGPKKPSRKKLKTKILDAEILP